MCGVCIFLEIDRVFRVRLSKTTRRDRCRVCAKFESSRRFRGSNMNHKKASSMPMPRSRSMPRFIDSSFLQQPCVWLLVLEVPGVLGRAGGLPSGHILTGLSRTTLFILFFGIIAKGLLINIYIVRPARMRSSVPLLEPGPPRFFWWYKNSE